VLPGGEPDAALSTALAHPGRIHLLLTDVVMPRLGAREAAFRLRAAQPDARVLCMSGYPDEAIGQQGALGPGMEFIQKPFTAAALLRKIRLALDAP
jgi:CheY-like chemotaxis protein